MEQGCEATRTRATGLGPGQAGLGKVGREASATAEQGGGSRATYISAVNLADSPLDSSRSSSWVEMQPWHPGKAMLQERAGQRPRQKPEGSKLQREGLRGKPGQGRPELSFVRWYRGEGSGGCPVPCLTFMHAWPLSVYRTACDLSDVQDHTGEEQQSHL